MPVVPDWIGGVPVLAEPSCCWPPPDVVGPRSSDSALAARPSDVPTVDVPLPRKLSP